ncbi:hypothetical protein KR222_007024 [Zaprionus bogoriensis]|nr:hypothetical protein KR222_007024 [Zaprionus bogoriensis]
MKFDCGRCRSPGSFASKLKMEIQNNNNKSKAKYMWLGRNYMMPSLGEKKEENSANSCICQRKRGLITCNSCQKSFVGRIGERCPDHPEIAYLMDARNCAFCGAAAKHLKMDQM